MSDGAESPDELFDPVVEDAAQEAEFQKMLGGSTVLPAVPLKKCGHPRAAVCGCELARGYVDEDDLPAEFLVQSREVVNVDVETGAITVAGSGNTEVVALQPRCGAKKRDGDACRNLAGFRTDHLGEGRCYLHGGKSTSHRLEHGRYATIEHTTIGELFEKHLQDDSWQDIERDVKMARALLEDWINNYDEWRESMLRWNASFQTGDNAPKPNKIMELADGVNLLDKITKMVERVKKWEAMNAISRPDLNRAMAHMARAVDTYVPDVGVRRQIAEAWLNIQI